MTLNKIPTKEIEKLNYSALISGAEQFKREFGNK